MSAWYRHYSRDFVHGVIGLGAAEIGAYAVILDLIYDRGGPIPDDSRWIGGILGEHSRRARTLIQHLIDAGKLVETSGKLSNKRAERELIDAENIAKRQSLDAKKAASLRWSDKQNQSLSHANTMPPARAHDRVPVPEADKKERPTDVGPKKSTRGTRLPTDWLPNLDDETFALQAGFSRAEVLNLVSEFRDYWRGVPAAKGIKLDWAATWRNSIRRAAERKSKPNGHGPPRQSRSSFASLAVDMMTGRNDEQTTAIPIKSRPPISGKP